MKNLETEDLEKMINEAEILEIGEFQIGFRGCGGWIFAVSKGEMGKKYYKFVQEERVDRNTLVQFYVASDGKCVAVNDSATEYASLEEALELEGFTEDKEEEEDQSREDE